MQEIDPTNSTSPNVRRSTFLGATAAAAAGTATLGPAFAQTELGKAHPPLVPESDPSIETLELRLQTPGGAIPAYAAWPKKTGPITPGIVVVMHIWGVDTSIRDFVRRLAKAGFTSISPDLYGLLNAPPGDGATDFSIFRPFSQMLNEDQTAADLRAGAQWIWSHKAAGKIAILGFCMGGAIALEQIAVNAVPYSAGAIFYGNISNVVVQAVKVPVVGSYGGRDTSIPGDMVQKFAQDLQVPHDFVVYPDAGHAFMDDQRSSYVADAAEDAWRRTITFLTKYLKA